MVSFGRKKKPSGGALCSRPPSQASSSEEGNAHLLSNAHPTQTRFPTRRQKFLKKVVHKTQKGLTKIASHHNKSSSKDTNKNGNDDDNNKKSSAVSISESIAAMLPEPIVKDVLRNMSADSIEVYLGDPNDMKTDPEIASVLEERERIREQLFDGMPGEEKSVEVSPQFRRPQAASSPERSQAANNHVGPRITISPQHNNSDEGRDSPEEEKKEDMDQPSPGPKPTKRNATPLYEDSEALVDNPAALFPAVTAAMDAANPTRVTLTSTTVSSSPRANNTSAAVVSPESFKSASSLDYSHDHHLGDEDDEEDRDNETASLPANVSSPPANNSSDPDAASMATPPSLADTGSYPSQSTRTMSTGRTGQSQSTRTGMSRQHPHDQHHLDDDPAIVEFQNNVFSRDGFVGRDASDADKTWPSIPDMHYDDNAAKGILDVFHCGDDMTEMSESIITGAETRTCRLVDAFYDNACWTYEEAHRMNRPYYDELFAKKFLHAITKIGKDVLWHLPPTEPTDEDGWSGRSAILKIKPGSCYLGSAVDPKLEWSTLGGGKEAPATDSVPLLDVLSISTFNDTISEPDDFGDSPPGGGEEECLFAITTEQGDVHVFEATSPEERDMLIAGLKNVIARLSYHLVVGEGSAALELYNEESDDPCTGELPSLPNPVATMNRISHALLD